MMMKTPGFITCRELDEKLDDYVAGKLSVWDRMRFAMHFFICKACAIYAAGYRKTVFVIKSSLGDNPAADEDVPEDLVRDILKKQASVNPEQ